MVLAVLVWPHQARSASGLATYSQDGCFLWQITGVLAAHDGGTYISTSTGEAGADVAWYEVAWPRGYTSAPAGGSQVAVLDAQGREVVRTGASVTLPGGYGSDGQFWACDPGSATP